MSTHSPLENDPVAADSSITLERGTIVGSYQILEAQRRSSYAEVFAARRLGQGARKELHEVHALHVSPDGARPRLTALSRAAADHPLRTPIDVVSLSGRICLVQPRPVGESLQFLQTSGVTIPRGLAVGLVAYVARELIRQLHGDLRPANVFFDYHRGAIRLFQWGVVYELEKLHRGRCLSTPAYSAPERFVGPIRPQTEVYSLGLMLWELLADRPAFAGDNPDDVRAAVERTRLEAPDSPTGSNSAMLNRIVMRAISRDPAERFQRTEDFARALEGYLASRGPLSNFEGALARFMTGDLSRRALARRKMDARLLTRAVPLPRVRSSSIRRKPSSKPRLRRVSSTSLNEDAFSDDLPSPRFAPEHHVMIEPPVEMPAAAYAEPMPQVKRPVDDLPTEDISQDRQRLYIRRRRVGLLALLLLTLSASCIMWILAGGAEFEGATWKAMLVDGLQKILAWLS